MLIAFLVPLFFFWSYILESIAYFLLHGTLKIIKITAKDPIQNILLIACTITFIMASSTCLTKTPLFFILISALWITIFTDLSHMLISRWVSLYLVPIGYLASWYGMTNITITESVISSFVAALSLMIINQVFYWFKGHDGLGQGDIELIACIGAWLGALATWFTIMFGSTLGTIIGLGYILWAKKIIKAVPFGPFLAFGAIVFMLFEQQIFRVFQ